MYDVLDALVKMGDATKATVEELSDGRGNDHIEVCELHSDKPEHVGIENESD